METKIIKVDRDKLKFNKDYYDAAFSEAAIIINKGGLVAFPTETVYGLGADATNPFASKRIYEAKGRPSDNPLIIHIYDLEQIKDYAGEIPDIAYVLAKRFWPGPLTMILKKKDIIPSETSGGLDTVGIRMPSDEVAREFLKYTSVAVAAPSANKSGRPSPTLASHVYEDMNNKIDMIIDAGDVEIGLESTIVDLTGEHLVILRPGAITLDMLREIDKAAYIDEAILKKPDKNLIPKAPGMKYRHYAPKAKLSIINASEKGFKNYVEQAIEINHSKNKKVGLILSKENKESFKADEIEYIGSRDNEEEIAHNLFAILRNFDNKDIDIIYSECFDNKDLGLAIMNRLTKAAGYDIVELST